jgi:anti-anti-sigma factor
LGAPAKANLSQPPLDSPRPDADIPTEAMNQAHPNLMVAVCNQVVWIKIYGRADFSSSLDLKKLINELWARGYNRFVFELAECLMMDSTFLGVLSGIGLKFCATSNGQSSALELVNPNPRITEVLDSLGVSHLFHIRSSSDRSTSRFEPLARAPEATQADVTRNCLEAHQTLMDINPDNALKFKDVAQFLAENLKRQESREKNGENGEAS